MEDFNQILARMRALTPVQIKAARVELGLSQEQFADLIGRQAQQSGQRPSVFSVSRWERGTSVPGILWGPTVVRLVAESEVRRAYKARQGQAALA